MGEAYRVGVPDFTAHLWAAHPEVSVSVRYPSAVEAFAVVEVRLPAPDAATAADVVAILGGTAGTRVWEADDRRVLAHWRPAVGQADGGPSAGQVPRLEGDNIVMNWRHRRP